MSMPPGIIAQILSQTNGQGGSGGASGSGQVPGFDSAAFNQWLGSHPGALTSSPFGPIFQKLAGMGSSLAPEAPGANFSRPMSQWGTPIPQAPRAIGPLSMLAMGMGQGSLNQWPPQASRPAMGGPTGTSQIPWLMQQRQQLQLPMQPQMGGGSSMISPPWMGPGHPGLQPVSGSQF